MVLVVEEGGGRGGGGRGCWLWRQKGVVGRDEGVVVGDAVVEEGAVGGGEMKEQVGEEG